MKTIETVANIGMTPRLAAELEDVRCVVRTLAGRFEIVYVMAA